MNTVFDNSIFIAMVRSALFMFYLTVGLRYFIFNAEHERSKYFLGIILLMWGLEMLKDGISQFLPWFCTNYIRHLYLLIDLVAIPFCTFYIMEMIYKHWLTIKRFVIHVVPFCIFLVLYACTASNAIYLAGMCYPIIYGIVALVYVIRQLKRYEKALYNNFSYNENLDVKWLHNTLILLIGNLFFCVWLYSSMQLNMFYIYYVYCLTMWCYVIFHTEKQQKINLVEMHNEPAFFEKEDTDIIIQSHPDKFADKLKICFEQDKIYLNPQLNIVDVSRKIGTNRTYLSVYLNNELKTNFYLYVNGFRLQEARKKLIETDTKIYNIAEDCGFKSFSTFVRAFKAQEGCTPTEYRNKVFKKK